MSYARIQNGIAVDVRSESPVGCFTDNIVAEFVTVPGEVQNGWLHDNGAFTAPPLPPVPTQAELDAIAAAEAARVSLGVCILSLLAGTRSWIDL